MRWGRAAGWIVLMGASLAGCASPAYYLGLAKGQAELLGAREPIASVVADDARDPALRRRLERVRAVRHFASEVLQLPRNGSYTTYVELGRAYVVWNVFATPEFSLEPHAWCHLLLGCLAYRGYFDEAAAVAYARELRARGDDVHVSGVPAYSTLGWFDDPVLSSMLHWQDEDLLGTVIHELAHQRLFIAGDTAFNESYASFVEREGLRQFIGGDAWDREAMAREQAFIELVLQAQRELAFLYDLPLRAEAMRAEKAQIFERLRRRHEALKQRWGGHSPYEAWLQGELNNAKLLPIGLYQRWVLAFEALFEAVGRDWSRFHEEAARIGRLPVRQREARLQALLPPVR